MKNRKAGLFKQNKSVDRNLLFLVLAFVAIGLIAVADVSTPQSLNAYGDKFYLLKQQLISAGIGLSALFVLVKVKYSFWEKIATPLFLVALIFLLLVLVSHLSLSALGARRWMVIGPVNFQPSEIIKFALCVYIAKVASKRKKIASYLIPLVLVAFLIMLQPDLGTTLIVVVIGLSQIFVSDVNFWYVIGVIFFGFIAGIPLILLSPYRKQRALTFLQMTTNPLSRSYHIRQVLLALGSGGIFGVGLGASRQKYLFLPEASSDSIFAVIAEELGLIGGIVVIAMFVYLVARGFSIAKNAPDVFSKVLAVGITVWIGAQAFLNIASMVAIVPLTGIPLPFISYGGSSLVMTLSACGILLNISKYVTNEGRS